MRDDGAAGDVTAPVNVTFFTHREGSLYVYKRFSSMENAQNWVAKQAKDFPDHEVMYASAAT
jgi:hypothetical protein